MSQHNDKPTVDSLANKALAGSINKRQFMQGAMALGLTVAAASSVWSTKVAAATPKKGGHFRIAMDDGNTTDTADPALYEGQYQIAMGYTHRSWLTEITPDNVVGPELATGWEASADASTWVFDITKGAEFHNGKTLTAQDVVHSLNYHRDPASKSAGAALLTDVKEIKADGPNKVIIALNNGSADLPYVLTDYHFAMLPSDSEGKVDTSIGAGSGAYICTGFEPGVRSDFKKNPNYYRDKGHFDSAEMLSISDVNARQNALSTDEIDMMIEVDTKTADLLGKNPNVNVIEVASGTFITAAMHVDVAPFDNKDVRLALKYAFPREEGLKKILRGHGTIGNDHPIAPVMPYWADLEQRTYDPDRARDHLKAAGLSSLKVDFSTSEVPMPGGVDLAILYKELASKAGIDLNVIREPNDGYWSNVWLQKPFCLVSWGQRPTPDVIFSLGYAAGADWNETHFADPRFNELLVLARAELDQTKRAEMYKEMQMIVKDDGGNIIPFFRNFVYAARSNVHVPEKLSGNWAMDGSRAIERWWFKG